PCDRTDRPSPAGVGLARHHGRFVPAVVAPSRRRLTRRSLTVHPYGVNGPERPYPDASADTSLTHQSGRRRQETGPPPVGGAPDQRGELERSPRRALFMLCCGRPRPGAPRVPLP